MKLATNKEFAEQYSKLETEKKMTAIESQYSKNSSRIRFCLKDNFITNLKVQFNQVALKYITPVVIFDKKTQMVHIKGDGVAIKKVDAQRYGFRSDGTRTVSSADTMNYAMKTNFELAAKVNSKTRVVPDASKLLKGAPNWGEWTALDAWDWSNQD